MLSLETDIINITRVGAATAKKLKKLGVGTVCDLLFYFPFRYDNFTRLTPIAKLTGGMSANVIGQIELMQNKRSWHKRMNITEALINDATETLKVIWFNQPFIAKNLKVGDRVSLAGKVTDEYGSLTMLSPVYEKILSRGHAIHTQGLVPNYHLTANLTNKQVRFLIKQVVSLTDKVIDWLPAEVKKTARLMNLGEALRKIHFPKNNSDKEKARERLAFDELFLIQLQAQSAKRNLNIAQAEPIKFKESETKNFVAGLPFKLTDAQRKAAWEILRDLEKDRPMSRLLEGDVGSGKTLVAIVAMLNAVLNGRQAALMVPTEILARQHFATVGKLLNKFDIKVGLVTRSQKEMTNDKFPTTNDKKLNAYQVMEKADIIIGTHALIQADIKFRDLALAIIDEQHRFGVEQRKALVAKSGSGLTPHFLSLTATPIPRSLALALYGDLELSVIDELPKERKKIITTVVPEKKRTAAYDFIKKEVKDGQQVFVVCPLIDFTDKLGVKSVEEEYQKLKKIVFTELRVGKVHGRLKAAEKEEVMAEFTEGKIDILVSTSVVEVGVDVPNASVMMIEGADRFGLAQLHQFRGRVGRSAHQSYCFLFTDNDSENSLRRLRALVDNHDGFSLAKLDLKFRGPGEVYGIEQKGFPELKMASLFDYGLMKLARDQAIKLINEDWTLSRWPAVRQKLGQWEKEVHLE